MARTFILFHFFYRAFAFVCYYVTTTKLLNNQQFQDKTKYCFVNTGYCTYSIIHKGTTSLGRLWKSCSPIDARHWLISVSETSSQILQVSPVLFLRKARDNATSECVKIQLFTYFLWLNLYNQLTSRYPRQIT